MKMFMIIKATMESGKFFTNVFVDGYGYPSSEIYFNKELAENAFNYHKSKGEKVKIVAFDCKILAEN